MQLKMILENNRSQSDIQMRVLLAEPIHNTLVGQQDYIDSNIVLNCTDIPGQCLLYMSGDDIKNPVLLREKAREAIDIFYNSLMSDAIGAFTQRELKLDNPFSVNGSHLIANVIAEAITCKEFPTLPRNIEIIAEKVKAVYEKEFERVGKNFYLRYFADYDELYQWLKKHLLTIPEITQLNLRQREYDAGYRDADVERPDFPRNQYPEREEQILANTMTNKKIRENLDMTTEAQQKLKIEALAAARKVVENNEDFIDLDTYINNIAQRIIRENIEINFSTFKISPSCSGCVYDGTDGDCCHILNRNCVIENGKYTGYISKKEIEDNEQMDIPRRSGRYPWSTEIDLANGQDIIESMKYDGNNLYEIREWTKQVCNPVVGHNAKFFITTINGEEIVSSGDSILKDSDGNFTIVKTIDDPEQLTLA